MVTADNGSSGSKMEVTLQRADWVKIAAWVTTIVIFVVGVTAGLMTTLFQSRTEAVQEHAAIERSMAVQEATAKQLQTAAEKRSEEIDKRFDRQDALLQKVHTTQIRILTRLGRGRLPPPDDSGDETP